MISEALIRFSQYTPLKGRGGYGLREAQKSSADPHERFRQAYAEAATITKFYAYFPDLPTSFNGMKVLDFGCGYGGKTVEYGKSAQLTVGIEPFPNMIQHAEEYSVYAGSKNVEFKICSQDKIPFMDETFDIVVSHDVLEHVDNPEVSLQEISRVLKPGGVAYIVCPPYDGAFSHHLDYITCFRGLHWFFSAHSLIATVNKLLQEEDFGTAEQPIPKKSWSGERFVLPMLNGLTGAQLKSLSVKYFSDHRIEYKPIGFGMSSWTGRLVATALSPLMRIPWLRERVSFSIAAKLSK